VGCKADGMKFEDCPAYVRKRMTMEKHRGAARFASIVDGLLANRKEPNHCLLAHNSGIRSASVCF